MRKSVLFSTGVAMLFLASLGQASQDAVDNGRLLVKPYKNNTFQTGAYRMGKAELFGYIGELKDSAQLTGIVLRDSEHASDEQKHALAVTAKAQHIDAFVDEDGKLQPLVDPQVAPVPDPVATPAAAAVTDGH